MSTESFDLGPPAEKLTSSAPPPVRSFRMVSPPLPGDPPSLTRQENQIANWRELPAIELDSSETVLSTGKFLPSWAVSFLFHLVLLVLLGVFGLTGKINNTLSITAANIQSDPLSQELAVDFSLMTGESQKSEALAELELVPHPVEDIDSDSPVKLEGIGDVYADADLGHGLSGVATDEMAQTLMELAQPPAEPDKNQKANFFGLSARGSRFVYVLDCSGSMGGPRWEYTVRELFRSLRSMDESNQFLVLLYNNDAWAMFNTLPKDTVLIPASKENVDKLERWFYTQFPNGSTLPMRAMSAALSLNPDAIFLLSDGEFQDDTVGYLQEFNKPQKQRDGVERRIPIHTFALDFSAGLLFLRQIAEDNDGQFRMITVQ